MTDHVLTRRKLRAITSKDEFNTLLDKCILSDNYKEMLRMYYLEGKDFLYIADHFYCSESTIKRWHKCALERLGKYLK